MPFSSWEVFSLVQVCICLSSVLEHCGGYDRCRGIPDHRAEHRFANTGLFKHDCVRKLGSLELKL
jgi:hypothetical protein